MKYLIEEATLTGIADAVREKKGTTDLIQVSNLATEISNIQGGGTVEELTITSNGTYNPPTGIDGFAPVVVNVPQDGAPTAEDLTFSGDFQSVFSGGKWDWIINKYGSLITTKDLGHMAYAFSGSKVKKIPFIIQGKGASNSDFSRTFEGCQSLEEFPDIRNFIIQTMNGTFSGCSKLREMPESFIENNQWWYFNSTTSSYGPSHQNIFMKCFSLKKIPTSFFSHYNKYSGGYYSIYNGGFRSCFSLEELTNLPCYEATTGWTSNGFSNSFTDCNRLKNIIFTTNEDNTAKVVNWKSQTIDLSKNVGYASSASNITGYNSGITADKEVKDDATYQALKDDPDWFSCDINYSRYNHDSAVNTINSLPDTSAYLTANGGTNTIMFNGQSGALTDGGAINTLTEEEIAVATAKGWSVALV